LFTVRWLQQFRLATSRSALHSSVIVFGSRVLARLIIGSSSCQTRLHNRVGRVDMNPTRGPELPSLLWIDATCAKETGKLWTTFFFIVMWLLLCGILFFLGLVCLGLYLGELSIYFLVGERQVGQGVLQFGRWCLYAFFGVFGRREILGVLKTWRIPWRILLHRFYICCIFERRLFCHPCLLAFLIFLFVFLCLLRRFLVYTSSVLRGAPYAFFFFL
jgi:hypothetical protein